MKILIALLAGLLLQANAQALQWAHASGHGKQVRLVSTTGKVTWVREKYPVRDVRVADDGTAAWLLINEQLDEPPGETGSSTLVVMSQSGRHTLTCLQLIREFWFWQQGRKIAYDCGGRHFAGHEVLFDSHTGKELAQFDQGDVEPAQRPKWSSPSGIDVK